MKAVIVDIRGRWAAALGEDGAVVRIPNAAYQPGQTIELRRADAHRTPRLWKKAGSLAAAAALVLCIGAGTAYALPCGTVSLDGESSLAYTVNCFDYVLDVRAADEESAALLEEIDVSSLRHKRIDTALRSTVEQLESAGYRPEGSEPLRVTADTRRPAHDEKLHAALEEALRLRLPAEAASETEAQPVPEALPAPQEAPDGTSPAEAERPAPRQPETQMQPDGEQLPEPQAQPDGSMPGPAGPDAPTGEQPPESMLEDAAFPGGGQPAPDGPGAPSIEQPPMAGPDAFPGPASPGAPPQA